MLNEDRYSAELEKINRGWDQRMKEMDATFKTQKADWEAQIRSMNIQIRDLEQDLQQQMNENMQIKLEAEEQIRETVVRV